MSLFSFSRADLVLVNLIFKFLLQAAKKLSMKIILKEQQPSKLKKKKVL